MNQDTFGKIEQAIKFIERNKTGSLTLKEIADSVALSEYHFHRLFTEWAGTTPDRFFKFLKKEFILNELHNLPLLEMTFKAGLSNPSRLHDILVTYEAVTPGEWKHGGPGLTVYYGYHETPFGEAFIAVTDRGILELQFTGQTGETFLEGLKAFFPSARFIQDTARTGNIISDIFNKPGGRKRKSFHLLLKGTNFQIKVWEALVGIPYGRLIDYAGIAHLIGEPRASRAVGTAIGRNTIAFLIPCHRVINKVGDTGHYRWGPARKKAMIGWELAHTTGEQMTT